MVTVIKLDTAEKVKDFTALGSMVKGRVYAKQGPYIINGKSFLGVLSLDRSKPIAIAFPKKNATPNFLKIIEENKVGL